MSVCRFDAIIISVKYVKRRWNYDKGDLSCSRLLLGSTEVL